MNGWALAVGVVATLVLIRTLVIGSASPGGEALRRDEEPALYWSVVLFNLALVAFLLWKGFSGTP